MKSFTRCPECKTKIWFTDDEEPDLVLISHRHKAHGVAYDSYTQQILDFVNARR